MRRPIEVYTTSCKRFPESLPVPEYPLHDMTRTVRKDGSVSFGRKKTCYISAALAGELIGLREVREHYWLVSFLDRKLGYINERIGKVVDS